MRPDVYRIRVRRGFSGRVVHVVYRPGETMASKTALSLREAFGWIQSDTCLDCPHHAGHGQLRGLIPHQVQRP